MSCLSEGLRCPNAVCFFCFFVFFLFFAAFINLIDSARFGTEVTASAVVGVL